MNVRIFKMVDGSELIGRVDGYDANIENSYVYLKDPLEIKYRMSVDTGAYAAVMTKYNYFGDEETLKIRSSTVITSYAVNEKFSGIYEKSLDTVRKTSMPIADEEESAKQTSSYETLVSALSKMTSNNTVH